MDHPMSKEESYADRRQLFKNIWETAMTIDEKEGNVLCKPKVIKTLRLDEVDRCIAGKKKKQRIKNLRIVCNKLLDFCDRQDADDMFYEQIVTRGRESTTRNEEVGSTKKLKSLKEKRKAKYVRSMCTPMRGISKEKHGSSDRRGDLFKNTESTKSSRNMSPIQIKSPSFICKPPLLTKKSLNAPNKSIINNIHKREKCNRLHYSGMQCLPGTYCFISSDIISRRYI